MILRPLKTLPPDSEKFLSAWEAVEHTQTQTCGNCWMITQPSHAALAGELAANLTAPQFPMPDSRLLQAIALHDAGWGIPDAQAIMRSRSVHQHQPQSFLAMPMPQFLEAWEKSIATSESVSPAGGYVVSRHFWRLAEHRVGSLESSADRQALGAFLKNEERRQKRLVAGQSLSTQQLEGLTDLLQFCDLLSLYICCGTGQSVFFPEYFGLQLRVASQAQVYNFDPPIVRSGAEFKVATLRHPATKEESSREIQIRIW